MEGKAIIARSVVRRIYVELEDAAKKVEIKGPVLSRKD